MNRLHILTLALLIAPLCQAQQTEPEAWLRLDVVVFKRSLAAPVSYDDAWAFQALDLTGVVDIADPVALTAASVYAYDDGHSLLSAHARQLDGHGSYQVMVVRAFLFPPRQREHAPRFRLHDGQALTLNEAPRPDYSNYAWLARDAQNYDIGAPPVYLDRLDGVISAYRERYLHISVDLNLVEPLAGIPARYDAYDERPQFARTDVQSYRLTASRRVKTETIHYFDHPRFGMLAQLTWIPVAELPPELSAHTDSPQP